MKPYVKPVLCYENFELTQSIAYGCASPLNHNPNGCFVATPTGELLFSGASCNLDPSLFEDYCEFTGSATMNVFTS